MLQVKCTVLADKDLDQICRRIGISRARLAHEADVGYEFLSHANSGRFPINEKSWYKLKKVLDQYEKDVDKKYSRLDKSRVKQLYKEHN